MSDINRLPPICEVCEAIHVRLHLAACCGGAAGDVFLCNQHMAEHERQCQQCAERHEETETA